MYLPLNKKELLLLSAGSVLTAMVLPLIVVPLLMAMTSPSQDPFELSAASQSDYNLVEQCKDRISDITNTDTAELRIDQRSTGYRDDRFNVHGFVRQGGEEFDFQCWYKADRSFDSHYIGRVSLEAISRQKALGTSTPF